MPPAYTVYKFKKMIGLVFTICIILAVLSVLNPAKEDAISNVVKNIDETGTASKLLETKSLISNPKGEIEQTSGNFFYKLITNNSKGFMALVVVIALILFALGVGLKPVRSYQRGLMK
ncbi:MAG: hypothetical protein ABIB43_02415 [archaeon]